MKMKWLFGILTSFSLMLSGCASDPHSSNDDGDDDPPAPEVNKFAYVKTNSGLELKSDASYSIKNFHFEPIAPIFENGHVDHFVIALAYQELITHVATDYNISLNASFKAKSAGSIYFNLDYGVNEKYKDSVRVELFESTKNKSVIYSYNGGESLTEGEDDLDADGQPDKTGYLWDEQHVCIYTTGEHSYQTEKFNENPYLTVEENEEINIRVNFWFDGFYTNGTPGREDPNNINLLFELK